ncbi:hypothetical protein [Pseudomonas sp. Teo4]|uniref:hypothetical protein n=1 Tax=Pseudomonas sp. Teo4 TaxID=3064528 RepID=UPI002ABCFD1C|nr:hypothetical protein [Pseudomonas sp. Teo4]MDZ3991401.1 hypothetical protein [Pseudomonas sp. Teo4]
MSHKFQLTYTVRPLDTAREQHVASADKARRILRNDMGWKTTGDIETTLLGEVKLTSTSIDDKAREAKHDIRNQIKSKLEEADVLKHIEFEGSLMVNKLDGAIKFYIP